MMIVEFEPEHALRINLQARQASMYSQIQEPGYAENLATGPAVSGLEGDEVKFCTGKLQIEGQWVLWALLSADCGRYLTRLTRIGRRWVATHDGWLFTLVDRDFPEAVRWMEILGFTKIKPCDDDGLPGMDGYGRLC